MIYIGNNARERIDELFYYPFTIGSRMQRFANDIQNIRFELSKLPVVDGSRRVVIPSVGTVTYGSDDKDILVKDIRWNTALTSFYFNRANFITFTSQGDVPSVHPTMYTDRNEPQFRCDNGFMVVSRKVRGKELFNFKNLSGGIVSDIDFTQVLPFSKDKGMTARGYKPNRTCWMIYPTGRRIQVDEANRHNSNNLITESEQRLKHIISESVRNALIEALNEKTLFEDRSLGRWKPNRVRIL